MSFVYLYILDKFESTSICENFRLQISNHPVCLDFNSSNISNKRRFQDKESSNPNIDHHHFESNPSNTKLILDKSSLWNLKLTFFHIFAPTFSFSLQPCNIKSEKNNYGFSGNKQIEIIERHEPPAIPSGSFCGLPLPPIMTVLEEPPSPALLQHAGPEHLSPEPRQKLLLRLVFLGDYLDVVRRFEEKRSISRARETEHRRFFQAKKMTEI